MPLLMSVGTIVWFVLTGFLWYFRPGDIPWLFGSLILGTVWFVAFAWYVTRKT